MQCTLFFHTNILMCATLETIQINLSFIKSYNFRALSFLIYFSKFKDLNLYNNVIWQANRSLANREIISILWNPTFRYRNHKSFRPLRILSQMKPAHASKSQFVTIPFNIILPSTPRRWFDPSWCQWNFHWHKILPIALWPWVRLSL